MFNYLTVTGVGCACVRVGDELHYSVVITLVTGDCGKSCVQEEGDDPLRPSSSGFMIDGQIRLQWTDITKRIER